MFRKTKRYLIIALLLLVIGSGKTSGLFSNIEDQAKTNIANSKEIAENYTKEDAEEFESLIKKTQDVFSDALNMQNLVDSANDVFNATSSLQEAELLAVIDGDTILVNVNGAEEKVRLIGIDTPESVNSDESKNNEYGVMASYYTKSILEGKDTIYLQYDVEKKDTYGRTLCYVWLEKEVDTDKAEDIESYMLNDILLRAGQAVNKVYMPNCMYADKFEADCKEAKENGTGLWEYEGFKELWD